VTWACLWRTRIALVGIVPYLAGFALWPAVVPPDLRVSARGNVIAFRGSDGRLALDWTTRDNFVARRWLEADGDGRTPDQARIASPARCDDAGCTAQLTGGIVLALPRRSAALEEDCARADIVVTRARGPPNCARPRLVIDRAFIDRAHGIVLTLRDDGVRVSTLGERCGSRPWCPNLAVPRFRRTFVRRTPAPAQ
jgi:competence protein ComEC